MSYTLYRWDGSTLKTLLGSATDYTPPTTSYDWAAGAEPWRYDTGLSSAAREALFTSSWAGSPVAIVDLAGSGTDLRARLDTTLNAQGSRKIVRLPAGDFQLTSFQHIGSDPRATYAFGYYHSLLAGLIGAGPDQTFVTLAAGSMTSDQLTEMQGMSIASGSPLQQGTLIIGGGTVWCAGFTLRAYDQQNLTAVASDLVAKGVVVPQPAPHQGLVIGQNRDAYLSYVRLQGPGRAMYPSPPFEMACLTQQYGGLWMDHYELDGRLSPAIDPARPRRCGTIMTNNPSAVQLSDGWHHHCNVSRDALNSENQDTGADYVYQRVKVEAIGNGNVDPNLNGGATLGGYSAAVCCGFETSREQITYDQPVMSVDYAGIVNSVFSCHFGFTTVGTERGTNGPQGGRLTVNGGIFRNTAFPQMDGYLTIRVSKKTYWYLDGYATTVHVYDDLGAQKSPWVYTGSTPPTSGQIAAAGISPSTHYIIHETS